MLFSYSLLLLLLRAFLLVFLNRFVRKMPPKAIADLKVKILDLFRSISLVRTSSGSILNIILSISYFIERTLNTTSDSDKIERKNTFIKNMQTARKKYLINISRVEESGSFIL